MAFSAEDIVSDSPTNNFATWNALKGNFAYSDGNLTATSSGAHTPVSATIVVPSKKWYWEVYIKVVDRGSSIGVNNLTSPDSGGQVAGSIGYYTSPSSTSSLLYNGGSAAYGVAFGEGSIVGVFLNIDDLELTFYKDGSAQSTIDLTDPTYNLGNNTTFTPYLSDGSGSFGGDVTVANFGQDPTFGGATNLPTGAGTFTPDNGIGSFAFQPPAGAKALCTANLPDFTPTVIDDVSQDYFKTVLYTGNDGTQSITGVGFQPDLVWVKERTSTSSHQLHDSVRGAGKALLSNSSNAQTTSSTYLNLFISDGFRVGSSGAVNSSTDTYVAWCWKAGGAPDLTSSPTKPFAKNGVQYETLSAANITAGTITPTAMSVNTKAGFSIVKYTGTGANATVPHGLTTAPDVIIVKNLDDTGGRYWIVYHHKASSTPHKDFLYLNEPDGVAAQPLYWNNTYPTSSVFSLGGAGAVNRTSDAHIAYCWHSVEGYSKFGSYTGNGSPDGPFVYTGFRPAFVMVKWTSGGGLTTGSWRIMDTARNLYNPATLDLIANEAVSETTYGSDDLDILSNGFKWRSTGSFHNTSGANYIYMAFAEQPFKYSNAR